MTEPRRAPSPRPTRERSGVGGLVGSGPSIVGVSGAMRARDVSRPGDAHDAAAEHDVVIRRRAATGAERPQRGARPADS
ncbi:MAG TPA: hypothetical protein VNA12_03220 [Mycobacteriales bacterium]|nr:hypothetical protein [Mycobacteriales bacterium]